MGNYITMAKCAADAEKEIGLKPLRQNTFVHAHGTGTPANRTTESHILNEIAQTFGIKKWPVSAIKSYLGHSMAPASGDQLIASLGTWNSGVIPGIHSTDTLAEDVYSEHLDILLENKTEEKGFYKGCFLNAKGFGGNNASAFILSPEETRIKIQSLFTKSKYDKYLKVVEKTRKNLENKVFERLINPENQSINIEPRQGYGIKERKALEKAIDRLNQLAQ